MKTKESKLKFVNELTIEEQVITYGGNEASDAVCYWFGVIARCWYALAEGARDGSGYGIHAK